LEHTKQPALIFANGDLNDGPAVRAALAHIQNPLVIAADGGARNALACNLSPHLIIGDFDSLTPAELRMLAANGAEIQRHSMQKDETDLELVLLAAAERGCDPIRVIGGIGDRLDQTLGNVYLLGLPGLRGRDCRMVAGKQTAWLIYPGESAITGTPGDTLSLIPISDAATNITTRGLQYPLRGETLRFGPARGISNVFTETEAGISFDDGLLLLVHTLGRA
jgi:thiamine pyrophosphokinase